MAAEWRYLPGGRVKHVVERMEINVSGLSVISACAAADAHQSVNWRGTGSQDECERLEALPACQRCVALGYAP